MNKKVLIILLSFAVFAATSCGGKENKAKDEEKNISIKEELQEIDSKIDEPIDTSAIENLSEAEKTAIEESTIRQTITPVDVLNTYKKKFPNTKVYKIEYEKEKGKLIYEIEGFNNNKEYELKIDQDTGKIIEEKTKISNDNQNKEELAPVNIEKIEKFVKKTIEDMGDGTSLLEWTLKMKNGIPEIEIEINNKGKKIEQVYNIETEELLKIKE